MRFLSRGTLSQHSWGVLALTLMASGCATNNVRGIITPEYFQFKTVVPRKGDGPGGWQAVCIHALIKEGGSEAVVVCKFEVSVPLYNKDQGEISLERAQFAAASMANRAARAVLSEAPPGEMMALLCRQFKTTYQTLLQHYISGARVGECRTQGVPVIHFGVNMPCPCQ